jgi:CRP/FNR family transcriptional regulator, cyclic AMP receptor protein
MARQQTGTLDLNSFFAKAEPGKTVTYYAAGKGVIFSQGDNADAVFCIQHGKVKLTVQSKQGKEAVIGLLNDGSFFGEGCLSGQPLRLSTATAITPATIVRLDKQTMIRLLHKNRQFADFFTSYLLAHTLRVEEDLVDQLFYSSEKRLARILLLLAQFGKEGKPEPIIPKISQDTLAAMVGTTRPRINHFMNKFRKLGFVDYNGVLEIHSSLLSVVLHD